MSINTTTLFKPAKIGQLSLKNTLAVAPMTRTSANAEGTVGPLMQPYYEAFAEGGFGLIITEGLYTDMQYSQGYFNQPGIATKQQANSWEKIIDGVHKQGSAIIAQLMHAGALSQYNRFSSITKGPSAVKPKGEQMTAYFGKGDYLTPEAMTERDIEEVVIGFTNAALLAQSAGFDGIEIHGANGYLLDQFLTLYTNQRADGYGGKLENRLRIYTEIIQAVRHAVGNSFIVGVRFSQKKVNDSEYLWPEGEAAAEYIFKKLAEIGVDYIHTTEPELNKPAFNQGDSLSSLAKKHSGLPVIANGGVTDAELAIAALKNDQADIVSLGRIALSNPDWPNRVNKAEPIKAFTYSLLSPTANLK